MLHLAIAADATAVAQLFAAGVTERVAYAAAAASAAAVGLQTCIVVFGNQLHTHLGGSAARRHPS
jgi:hypothetical protein